MRAAAGLALTLFSVAVPGATLQEEVVRNAFNGSHRVLLVFSPGSSDPRAARLDALLHEQRCGVEERHMVIGRLPLDGPATMGAEPISRAAATRLRDEYRVGNAGFRVILVGKDGGEKSRDAQVPDLSRIFALIDGMPMRREEIRSQVSTCGS